MKVAEVEVNVKEFGKMKAFVNVIFRLLEEGDGCITIRGFRLFDGANGHFLAMPSEKTVIKNSETGKEEIKYYDRMYFDYKIPEANALLEEMTQAAVIAYKAKIESNNSQTTSEDTGSNNSPINEEDLRW